MNIVGQMEKLSDTLIVRYTQGGVAGPHVDFGAYDLLNPPPYLQVLDIETSGIDPYQFLNLPNRKRKK